MLDPDPPRPAPRVSEAVRLGEPAMVALRRDLHAHPELGFRETRTARLVGARLDGLGFRVRTGVGQTGVTGILEGGRPGPTILLRADMDALPLDEAVDVPWRSQTTGVMHACGHDAHTAMVLLAAEILGRDRAALPGRLLVVFQPAEELLTGAAAMLADDALDGLTPTAGLAVHLQNELPVGTMAVCPGPVLASADKLELVVRGRGGHAAVPHRTADPVVAAAHIVSALQTLVSRETPPTAMATLSVTMVRAGTAFNVIPDRVEMTGTLRCYDERLRHGLLAGARRIAVGMAAALGCSAEVRAEPLTAAVVNDPVVSDIVRAAAGEVVGPDRVVVGGPVLGSDDLAYFWERVPGCYAFIGSAFAGPDPAPPHHTPGFDFDEAAMAIGAELLVRATRRLFDYQVPEARGS